VPKTSLAAVFAAPADSLDQGECQTGLRARTIRVFSFPFLQDASPHEQQAGTVVKVQWNLPGRRFEGNGNLAPEGKRATSEGTIVPHFGTS
jgi:hypothetical protein